MTAAANSPEPELRQPADTKYTDGGPVPASYFWRNVARYGHAPALVSLDAKSSVCRAQTWGELGDQVRACMAWLIEQGLSSGQHVATCQTNSLAWILWDLAAQTLGLVHVAIDPRASAAARTALLEFSQAACLLDEELWLRCRLSRQSDVLRECISEQMRASRSTDAAAQMLFTSGSSGSPKGVLLSGRNLLSNAWAKLHAVPQRRDDLRLNLLPFAHAYARTCELSTWLISAGRLALARDWDDLLSQAPMLQPSLINLVPYLAEQLADELDCSPGRLGSHMRLLQVGGAGLPDTVAARLHRHGLPPLQGYGLTEAAPVVCSNTSQTLLSARYDLEHGTVGWPVSGVEVRLDSQGVLQCRGPNVMLGYWQDTPGTRAVIQDGWLHTGDLAEFTAAGRVRILGRQSSQIVLSTGYKVSPELIEDSLHADAWIRRAVVFGEGRPHVVALIWLSDVAPSIDADRLRSAVLGRIRTQLADQPRYAIPERFAIVQQELTASDLTVKGQPHRRRIATSYSAVLRSLGISAKSEL